MLRDGTNEQDTLTAYVTIFVQEKNRGMGGEQEKRGEEQ